METYTDVRFLGNTWANGISMNHRNIFETKCSGGKSIHITFDNSDEKQQTFAGYHTTHHATCKYFKTKQHIYIPSISSLDIQIKPVEN